MSRLNSLSALGALVCIGACTSIIGIEDLHEGPRTESEAGEGQGGSDAGSPNGGASINGGSPGEGGLGGDGGAGLSPSAGAGGEAGSPPQSGPVSGNVIDFWGHPLPNIPIQIGDELISTDEDGKFEFADVAATYDVSMVADFDNGNGARSFAWVYQGLTRRDPTLQIYWALPTRSGNAKITPQNVTTDVNEVISLAIGGEDGNLDTTISEAGTTTGVGWEGGPTTSMTAHALYWEQDANTDLPIEYFAYDSSLVALSDSETAQIALDLTKGAIDSGPLQGTVTSAGGQYRTNFVFLHFTSGATLELVNQSSAPNTFSYVVPSIPNSSLTVMATEGDAYSGAYAVARATGLAVNGNATLQIPKPVTLTSPANAIEKVNSATKFSFASAASNPGPYVVQFDNVDTTGTYQTLFVVTGEKQVSIPEVIGGGFELQAGKLFAWRVATHGPYGSVDAAARPEGFIQPFNESNDVPYGPQQEDGEYTISAGRLFTTASK